MKTPEPLRSPFRLGRIQFKRCRSRRRPRRRCPAVVLPFAPGVKHLALSVISILHSKEVVHGLWKRHGRQINCGVVGVLKETGQAGGCFTAPPRFGFFFPFPTYIASSFFVVKCRGKLDGLAEQRWMFSLKRSADGAHSRGKLCKSLH